MPVKLQRQQSSEAQGSLQAVEGTACWVAFLGVIDIHLLPFNRLLILLVMFFLPRKVTGCQRAVRVVEGLNLLRWTPLMPIGEKLGVMI